MVSRGISIPAMGAVVIIVILTALTFLDRSPIEKRQEVFSLRVSDRQALKLPVVLYDADYQKTVIITSSCNQSWRSVQLVLRDRLDNNWTEVLTTANKLFDMPGKTELSLCLIST